MKVKLNILERMTLAGTLPDKSNIDTITTVRDIKNKTMITIPEQKEANIVVNNGKIQSFDDKKVMKEKEYSFSDTEIKAIQKSLHYYDSRKKLTANHISLFNKFMNKQ